MDKKVSGLLMNHIYTAHKEVETIVIIDFEEVMLKLLIQTCNKMIHLTLAGDL